MSKNKVEFVKVEPVVLEVRNGDRVFSHLVVFEITVRLRPLRNRNVVMDGDIKQTTYLMREF